MPVAAVDWRVPRSSPESHHLRKSRLFARLAYLKKLHGLENVALAEAAGVSLNYLSKAFGIDPSRHWRDLNPVYDRIEAGIESLEETYGLEAAASA